MSDSPLPRCIYHPADHPAGIIREGQPVVQYSLGHFPPGWEGVFVEEIGAGEYAHKACHEEAAAGRTCASPSRGTAAGA
jgi:hypothetical protein